MPFRAVRPVVFGAALLLAGASTGVAANATSVVDRTAMASRLARSDSHAVSDPRLLTIANDGALDDAAEAFVRLLARLRYSPGARRRA